MDERLVKRKEEMEEEAKMMKSAVTNVWRDKTNQRQSRNLREKDRSS